MKIPENMCSSCYCPITNLYDLEIGMCHDCRIFNMGMECGLNQAKRLKEKELNKHKLKGSDNPA